MFVKLGQNSGHQFNHGNLHAERLHHARELAADDSATDNQKITRKRLPMKRFVAGANDITIVRPGWYDGGSGAYRQDDVVAGYLLNTLSGADSDYSGRGDFAFTSYVLNLAGGEQGLDAVLQHPYDPVFAGLDLRPVEGGLAGNLNAKFARPINLVQQVRRRQQRL